MNLFFFLFISFIIYLFYDLIKKNRNFSKNDPPGPSKIAIPILGHLYLLGERPNRSLTELSKQFKSGIFKLWMGDQYTCVITDVDAVNEIWVKQFQTFVNRPHHKSLDQFSSGFRNLSFSDYQLWIELRKLVSPAFTKIKVKSYSSLFERQINYLIQSMNNYSINNKPFNPKKYIHKFSLNIICSISFSKEINQNEEIDTGDMARLTKPKAVIFKALGSGNLGDFCKILRPFFYFKNKEYVNGLIDVQKYIKEIYDDHIASLDIDNPKDIMDHLIISTSTNNNQNKSYEDVIIQTMLDFLIAGSDTAAVMIEWFILYMTNNLEIQEKVYKELVDSFGKDCKWIGFGEGWSDKTPYLNACIKETLRIKPVTSLGLPRVALEDTTVNGYFIPKGTQMIQNIYGLSNSDNFVENPTIFNPDRWLEYYELKQKRNKSNNNDDEEDGNINEFGKNKYYNDLDKLSIPFSIGRRGCVGIQLGETELYIACANLIYNFTLQPWDGNKLQELEDFGITIHPSSHQLKLIKRHNQ